MIAAAVDEGGAREMARGVGRAAVGFTHHLKGDLHQAIQYYHQSLSIKPDDTFTCEMLSEVGHRQGNRGRGGARGRGRSDGQGRRWRETGGWRLPRTPHALHVTHPRTSP